MVCDKCHDDTGGFQAKMEDGTVLCAKCLKDKKKRPSKIHPTKDPLVLLSRKLEKLVSGPTVVFKVIAMSGAKRCYTNGNCLLTDFDDKVPEDTTFMDIKTLDADPDINYINPGHIVKTMKKLQYSVDIPEELYKVLDVFKRMRDGRVVFSNGDVTINDEETKTSLLYAGATMELDGPLHLSVHRLLLLKPKRIEFAKETTVSVTASYDKTVDGFKHVILAGMATQ